MIITRVTMHCCLLYCISLFYLVDAAQNIPQEPIQPSATTAAPAAETKVISEQPAPVQQPVSPVATTGAPMTQQPIVQTTSEGAKGQVAIEQTAIQKPVASVQAAPQAPVSAAPAAPTVAPAAQPAVTPPAVPVTQPAVAPQVNLSVQPVQQPAVQPAAVQPTAIQPMMTQPAAQTTIQEKTEAPKSEAKEVAPTTEEAKKKVEQEIPAAPTVVPETKNEEVPVQVAKKQPVVPVGEGIDTLEQEGGNWLLKRQALEKTIDVIEKIKDVFTKTLEVRVDYLVKRNKTDRSFDTFANSIGFELGDLNQLLSTLVKQLKAERVQEGDLTEEERTLLQEVENKITELKSLKATLKSITEMDASLDEALMQLEKEITTSNSYQTRAWRNFQTIKKVLSDEKAEELYLQTESLLKNMQEILKYLNGDLLHYFDSVISTLKQNMSDTQEKIKALEAKGINLQEEVKKIKKAEKLARKGKKQKKEEAQKKEQEKVPELKTPQKEVKKEESWFDYIAIVWRYPLSVVNSIWEYGMSFFVTKKVAPKIPVEVTKAAEKGKKASEKEKVESAAKENIGAEKKAAKKVSEKEK